MKPKDFHINEEETVSGIRNMYDNSLRTSQLQQQSMTRNEQLETFIR